MQKWASMGPQWGPIVGWGLGLGLVVRAQAQRGLGHGPKSSAHSWALIKPNLARLTQLTELAENRDGAAPTEDGHSMIGDCL